MASIVTTLAIATMAGQVSVTINKQGRTVIKAENASDHGCDTNPLRFIVRAVTLQLPSTQHFSNTDDLLE